MIHRLQQGEVPDKPHTTFYQGDQLAFEHCFTRQGFDGAYAILYHPQPPHYIDEQEEMDGDEYLMMRLQEEMGNKESVYSKYK